LTIAVQREGVTLARALIDAGAPVDLMDREGRSALWHAARAGRLKDAQNDFGDTALIIASRDGNLALVRRLLTAGASAKLRNHDRIAAADVAEARNFRQLVQILQEN
jgi:ankyrin repeat protein